MVAAAESDPVVQCAERQRRHVVDAVVAGQEDDAVSRRPVEDQSDRRRLFSRRTMGGVHEHGQPPRPPSTYSRFRRQAPSTSCWRAARTARTRSPGRPTTRSSSTIRARADSRLSPSSSSRHLRSAIPRRCRDRSRSALPARDGRTTSRRTASSSVWRRRARRHRPPAWRRRSRRRRRSTSCSIGSRSSVSAFRADGRQGWRPPGALARHSPRGRSQAFTPRRTVTCRTERTGGEVPVGRLRSR